MKKGLEVFCFFAGNVQLLQPQAGRSCVHPRTEVKCWLPQTSRDLPNIRRTLDAYRCCLFFFLLFFPFFSKHSFLNFLFSARDLFLVTGRKAMLMGGGVILYACQVAVYSVQGPQNCLKQFRVRWHLFLVCGKGFCLSLITQRTELPCKWVLHWGMLSGKTS